MAGNQFGWLYIKETKKEDFNLYDIVKLLANVVLNDYGIEYTLVDYIH